jgi:hypothetical protein
LEQSFERGGVMPLPGRQEYDDRTTLSIRPDMELGREATPAPSNRFLRAATRSSGMLVDTDTRAINEVYRPIQCTALVGLPEESGQHALPDACSTPAIETIRHRFPWTEAVRQISPRDACLGQPQQTVEDAPVVVVRATWSPCTQWW